MTSLMIAIVGILIAAVGTAAGFVYFDIDSGSALEGGIVASHGIVALGESAASFQDATGSPPTSVGDVETVEDLPALPNFPGAAWGVTRIAGKSFACLSGRRGAVADHAIRNAAIRLGSGSRVSGECGVPGSPGSSIVLSYPIGAATDAAANG